MCGYLPTLKLEPHLLEISIMATSTISKKRKVINYLSSGNGLTANEAKARFGVSNLRATISNIRSVVEAFGNWEIVSEPTSTTGKSRYFMVDTHPGTRAYTFNMDGSRSLA